MPLPTVRSTNDCNSVVNVSKQIQEARGGKLQRPIPTSKTHTRVAAAVPRQERCTSEATGMTNYPPIGPKATPRTQAGFNCRPTTRKRNHTTSSPKRLNRWKSQRPVQQLLLQQSDKQAWLGRRRPKRVSVLLTVPEGLAIRAITRHHQPPGPRGRKVSNFYSIRSGSTSIKLPL